MQNPSGIRADYVLSSGALSFKVQSHEDYVQKMLEAMMSISTRGVAVNFLSSYVDRIRITFFCLLYKFLAQVYPVYFIC